jgi:alkylation response protein AidB-like acyl-CoA dehydrogenase
MSSGFDESQRMLQASVRGVLAAQPTAQRTSDSRRALWRQLAVDIGVAGIGIPEAVGGTGGSLMDLLAVAEEIGRQVSDAPFLSSVLTAFVLQRRSDEPAVAEVLPAVARGELIATLATIEPEVDWHLSDINTVAVSTRSGYRITGQKSYVLDGDIADLVVVVAKCRDEVGLFLARTDAVGLSRLPPSSLLDQTRPLCSISFQDTPARRIGRGDDRELVMAALSAAGVVLAADSVGGSEACLNMSVSYAQQRLAFGRPIGSFQSIKHKCADMFLSTESARSVVLEAGAAETAGPDIVLSAVANAVASEAYVKCSGENIQIHGGIGITWEHSAHVYFKRARASYELFGSPAHLYASIADRIGL